MTIVEIAAKLVGKTETQGKNRSVLIDNINAYVGNQMGDPYCAAGVSWCFREASIANGEKDRPRPKTGSSFFMRKWFAQRSKVTDDAQALLGWKGALGGWTNPDGHGHVFIIEKRYTSMLGFGRKVVAIGTIEFNTDGEGSRDGDGIWRRKRKVDERKFWFCDTSDLSGGAYW